MHWKNAAQNSCLTLVTLIFFFAAGEIALRVTGIDRGTPKTPAIYDKSEDPAISYQLKSNLNEYGFRSTIKTNSLGMRSPEPEAGKKTIVLLGDSITFGYGIENDETLGSRIDSLLDHQYNVMTEAAPGYTLNQERRIFAEKSEKLRADALVLVFFWNDLTDDSAPPVLAADGNLHEPGWVETKTECHPIEDGIMGYIPGRCWLDLHSAFYRTMKKIIVRRTEQQNMHAQMQESKENPDIDPITDAQIARYGKELQEFAASLPPSLPRLFVIWPEKTLHNRTVPKLEAVAKNSGFKTLNLYENFRNEMETLSWDTVHPSAASTAMAAQLMADMLKKGNLLPR